MRHQEYLKATAIIDWQDPQILSLASQLKQSTVSLTVKSCFEWVRDNIYHSCDYQTNPVTCNASQALKHKTGYCYAKSHLLAALLRANAAPTGFCYQRLSVFDNGARYCLHGFNSVYLPEFGWYRLDARGNKPGINAQFNPPQEQLAFKLNFPEEANCQRIFTEPLPAVITALQTYNTWDKLLHNLPDMDRDELLAI